MATSILVLKIRYKNSAHSAVGRLVSYVETAVGKDVRFVME
jgi:hypothetical protein